VAPEVFAIHGADLAATGLVFRGGERVDRQLDDVGELSTARAHRGAEVLHHLAELRHEIALADDLAVAIHRHLAGDVEGLAALHLIGVRVAHGLHEAGRIHGFEDLVHGRLPSRAVRDYTTRAHG